MSEDLNEEQKAEVVVKTEKEARTLGWVPKEDFRDGDHWVDAETFVKRGKEINPILRKNNEILFKKLEEAKAEIAEIKEAAKEFGTFQKKEAEKKVKELQEELKDLKEKKKQAYIADDKASVVALEDAIEAVEEEQAAIKVVEKKPEEKKEAKVLDPVLVKWMEKNEWFTTETKWTRMADAIGASINDEFPDLRGQAFLDKLDEELTLQFPEKFGKRTSPVEGNSPGGSKRGDSKKHTYENLPEDAKAACDRLIKQGNKITREQYVSFYDWS